MTLKKHLTKALVALSLATSLAPSVLAQSTNATSSSSTAATATSNEATKKDATTIDQVTKTPEEVIKFYRDAYPNQDLATVKLEYDEDTKRYVFEYEALDDDNEYGLILNAGTNEELTKTEQSLVTAERGGVERKKEALNLEGMKDFKDIKAAADKAVNNVLFFEWELDRDDNATVWTLTYKDGDKEIEVKVDAHTAQVLEVEDDRKDD